MEQHNIECPICGTVNHNLYLEETGGWMECEKCSNIIQILRFATNKKIPIYSEKQLIARFGAAH